MDLAVKEPARDYVIGAWLIAAALLWLVLRFDLLPALLAGLLVFELVHVLTMRLSFVRERRARIVAVAFIAVVVVAAAQPGDIRVRALLSQRHRRLRPRC